MITIIKKESGADGQMLVQFTGVSDDTKPTGKLNGSSFLEMDTGKEYRYDEDADAGSEWVEQPAQGVGGAANLSELSDVNITTPTDGQVLTYDQTAGKWKNGTPSGGSSSFEDLIQALSAEYSGAAKGGPSAELRNRIYGGRDLTETGLAAFASKIKDGSFEGLLLGDEFIVRSFEGDEIPIKIAHFNYMADGVNDDPTLAFIVPFNTVELPSNEFGAAYNGEFGPYGGGNNGLSDYLFNLSGSQYPDCKFDLAIRLIESYMSQAGLTILTEQPGRVLMGFYGTSGSYYGDVIFSGVGKYALPSIDQCIGYTPNMGARLNDSAADAFNAYIDSTSGSTIKFSYPNECLYGKCPRLAIFNTESHLLGGHPNGEYFETLTRTQATFSDSVLSSGKFFYSKGDGTYDLREDYDSSGMGTTKACMLFFVK